MKWITRGEGYVGADISEWEWGGDISALLAHKPSGLVFQIAPLIEGPGLPFEFGAALVRGELISKTEVSELARQALVVFEELLGEEPPRVWPPRKRPSKCALT